MKNMPVPSTHRRNFLLGTGALVVEFSLAGQSWGQLAGGGEGGAPPEIVAPHLPGDLKREPRLDSWIRVDAGGAITVFSGKVELGQGIRTALLQIACEELDVPPVRVTLVTADTARTPDEGLTAGSHSMQDSGTAIRHAAASVRTLLAQQAGKRWGLAPSRVDTNGNGLIVSDDGRSLSYGELAAEMSMNVPALANAPLRDASRFRTMGKSLHRIDIPAKLTGGAAYLQDMRLPGMLHARVVRGPSHGTRLQSPDANVLTRARSLATVVQRGNFIAVAANKEWSAIQAMRLLQAGPLESGEPETAVTTSLATLEPLPHRDIEIMTTRARPDVAVHQVKSRYSRPWLHHGSIGPSCAVALYRDGVMTVWSHSQGIFDVRRVIAQLLGLALDKIHVVHVEGSGCYGQNGADDVAADAALIAFSMPGRPIRLQWMREQEHGWEPLGAGMFTELTAALGANNRIVQWRHEVWSNSHNNRPVGAGGVIAGQEVQPPFQEPESKPIPMPDGDGSRNSNPLYTLPNVRVVYHFIEQRPTRVSALRSLGAHLNVFSIESMFDELASVGGIDPLALRLAHMDDTRARDVMNTAARHFNWSGRPQPNGRLGCGMGFARYKNLGAYCAVMMQIEVQRETGRVIVRRVVCAVDSGEVVNPDGIRNQIEGGVIQSLSWTVLEQAQFSHAARTSLDWSTYPIQRFSDVPLALDVRVIDRQGQPFLGTAEAAQGPTAAALANAVANALSIRVRDMPLSPRRIKALLEEQAGIRQ